MQSQKDGNSVEVVSSALLWIARINSVCSQSWGNSFMYMTVYISYSFETQAFFTWFVDNLLSKVHMIWSHLVRSWGEWWQCRDVLWMWRWCASLGPISVCMQMHAHMHCITKNDNKNIWLKKKTEFTVSVLEWHPAIFNSYMGHVRRASTKLLHSKAVVHFVNDISTYVEDSH